MAYKIVWTAEARLTYIAIIEYLEKEWSDKEIVNFVNRVDSKLNLLSTYPALGKIHRKNIISTKRSSINGLRWYTTSSR